MTGTALPQDAPPDGPLRTAYAAARRILPGLAVSGLVAMSAVLVTEHHGGPVMLMALLMGMAVGFLRENERLAPGLRFGASTVLRTGVALLGARITAQYLSDLGWIALGAVAVGVALTLAVGIVLARALGRSGWFGALAGGAVAICGASAAAAISAVLPRQQRNEADTAMTIIGVTALSTVAMVLYPVIGKALDLGDRDIGFFIGLTIHDVAQVVGAGYSVSDEAGTIAVVVKLFRVVLLLPVVLVIALAARSASEGGTSMRAGLPGFVIAFAILAGAGSAGLIPPAASLWLSDLSRWCLILAMGAIGIRTSLKELQQLGYRPAVVLIGSTVFIGACGLLATALLAGR